jgi:hypothetical protein
MHMITRRREAAKIPPKSNLMSGCERRNLLAREGGRAGFVEFVRLKSISIGVE